MAVFTEVSAEAASAFLAEYGLGNLHTLKGIAEGVQNSNYLIESDQGRFFLTLYENRVDPAELPYFHDLLAHLRTAGLPVPAFIEDGKGQWLKQLCGRPACLIEFLSGVSVSRPTIAQAGNVGTALARMHHATQSFCGVRENTMGLSHWRALAESCGHDALAGITPELPDRIARELDLLEAHWPHHLPSGTIHADLFPDNVLMIDDGLSGLIDFYFACTDIQLLDVAITHAAWSFSADGGQYMSSIGTALLQGYSNEIALSEEDKAGLHWLFRGACLRFLLTRSYDWVNTPAGAKVTRKDPLAFLRRLDFYSNPANRNILFVEVSA